MVKRMKRLNLVQLVNEIQDSVEQQFLKDMTPLAQREGIDTILDNLLIGGCVYLSHLLSKELKSKGYNANIRAGMASFGVNQGDMGIIEYGNPASLNQTIDFNGNKFTGTGFFGHAWVEVPEFDVVIDLTIRTLKEHFLRDNKMRGIRDNTFLFDDSKVIISRSELTSHDAIMSGQIGCFYLASDFVETRVSEKLKAILEDVKSYGRD
jgi:hypothetical protein